MVPHDLDMSIAARGSHVAPTAKITDLVQQVKQIQPLGDDQERG